MKAERRPTDGCRSITRQSRGCCHSQCRSPADHYWVVDDRCPSSIMLIMASSCDLNPAGSSGKLSGAAVAQRQHRHPQDAASFEEASLSLSSDLAAPK